MTTKIAAATTEGRHDGGGMRASRDRDRDHDGPQGNQPGHPFYGNQWTSGRNGRSVEN